ncbi:hypothetical protein [Bacillus alveayuensis]|uniref:hypothetical protein n=1 Tax=Aeribacillus alveayuensis TaxID=279215 RepID=UPI0005CCDCFC
MLRLGCTNGAVQQCSVERIVPKIHRLETSQFTSVKGLKSAEQHKQIIEVCKNKDHETTTCLLEGNSLSL